MADIKAMAEYLASSRFRFLTDIQIGTMRRKYDASRDEVRAAAVMADRIRRQRQLRENRTGFTVAPEIAPDAPIDLPEEKDRKEPNARRRGAVG